MDKPTIVPPNKPSTPEKESARDKFKLMMQDFNGEGLKVMKDFLEAHDKLQTELSAAKNSMEMLKKSADTHIGKLRITIRQLAYEVGQS